MSTIEERVAAGAAWLDTNHPGWVERIDMRQLDMADACHCVIGQTIGNYFDTFDWTMQKAAAELAFTIKLPTDEFADLERAWAALIESRTAVTR
jgi:hypothetical protein